MRNTSNLDSKNKTYLNAYTSVKYMHVLESKVFCCSLDSNVEEQIWNIKLIIIQIQKFYVMNMHSCNVKFLNKKKYLLSWIYFCQNVKNLFLLLRQQRCLRNMFLEEQIWNLKLIIIQIKKFNVIYKHLHLFVWLWTTTLRTFVDKLFRFCCIYTT